MGRLAALVLVGLAAAAAHAGDGEAKRFDLSAPEKWRVGEVVTVSSHRVTKTVLARIVEGEAPQERRRDLGDDCVYVRRCDSVDAAGAPSNSLVHVTTWLHAVDDDEDKSLEGALLETSPDGWAIVSHGTRPSPYAQKWLDVEFGRPPFDPVAPLGIRPDGPVAVGDTWQPKGCSMIETFAAGTRMPVRMKDAKSSVTLAGADGDVVHVKLASSASVEADPAARGGDKLQLAEPCKFELSESVDGVPSCFHGTLAAHTRCGFEITTQAAGAKVSIRVSTEQDLVATAGGEMPDVPAADPAHPAVRIARSVQWKAGDAVTDSGSTILSISETPVDEKGKAGRTTGKLVTTTWADVRRCEAAGADGVPTKFTVWVREWKSEEAGAVDECLKGAVVDVTAKGWKLRGTEVKPSTAARAWLARECGSAATVAGDDSMRAAITPFTPVAVGESWEPDVLAASAIVRGWIGMPIDPEGATASAKLEKSEGPAATPSVALAYSIDGPIKCVAGCSCSNSEVLEGGKFSVKGTTSGAGADWTRRGELNEEMKGSVALAGQGDACTRVVITQTRTRTRVPGGEVPQQ
jgi:hypothetical protein